MGKGFSAPVGRLRLQITAVLGLVLVLVWLTAWVDIGRNRQQAIHEAEAGTVSDARIFAEYSRSTIKRLDEFVLDARLIGTVAPTLLPISSSGARSTSVTLPFKWVSSTATGSWRFRTWQGAVSGWT